jgi:23S rRNA (cytosine1962-C5)-methyltransferase
VLTAYAIQASALIPYQALQEVVGSQGNLTCGELITIEESANHVLSHALFARWTP